MKRSIQLFAALALCLVLGVTSADAQGVSLTILHTNDTHGHLLPFSYPDAFALARKPDDVPRVLKDIGGIARRSTLVKQIRAEQKGRSTVWLVDVGDYSDGTPFSTEYHGEADVAAMNAAGYDFGTLGNHEFNNRFSQLERLIAATRYPVVSSNTAIRASGRPLATPFLIRRVGPLRVALLGLTTREAATYPAGKEAVDVANEIETARKMVAMVRPRADVIVVLSHGGEQLDERLADEVPGIDVIVGGHSHSRLPSGRSKPHSEELRASGIKDTVIVQAHQWGGELGRVDLAFTRDRKGAWHVDNYVARLVPITSDIAEDPEVARVVDRFWKPIAAKYGEVFGEAAGEFSTRGDDAAEYNLVADAVRETFGADFAMENMGGIRAPLLAGSITRADLVTMDPFDNTVVLFKATGREIKQILERHTPAVSGLQYRVELKKLVEASVGGQPLEDDKTYSGVTNSYFAGYELLKGLSKQDTGKPRLDVVSSYIRQKKVVRPSYDGRRVVIRNQG